MMRRLSAVLGGILAAGVLMTTPQTEVRSQDQATPKAPEGTWKLSLPLQGGEPWWLLRIDPKPGGGWTGKVLATEEKIPRSEVTSLTVKDGLVSFAIKMEASRLAFEMKLPKGDAPKMLGSVGFRNNVTPAELERTSLKSLDKQELNRETLASSKENVAVIRAAADLVSKAAFLKAKPEEVRLWVDRALKSAEPYGERLQLDVLLQLVEALNEQDGLAAITLPYARRSERMLTPKDRPALRKRVLDLLANALERAGQSDEAKEVAARANKIDYGIALTPFPPREGKNQRVVLMELFTGAECPPCVAADLAFDALGKTFQPSEAVLLQYHMHIPGPDPLSNSNTEARFKYYQEAFGRQVGGTPVTLFNGAPAAPGGGRKQEAQDKYDQYVSVIQGQLEQPVKLSLQAKATRKGDKISVKAEVSNLQETGATVRLRLVLAEEVVEYKGGNGLTEHHCVVRSFPGGAEGLALKDKTAKQELDVDVGEIRQQLKKYLEGFYKGIEEPLPKDIPMEMKKMRLIAFVQDDNTREIFQAVQVPVEDAK